MKKLLILLFLAPFAVLAAPALGPSAEISILTCSPGDELYSVFGHSAIRIYEPGKIDYVYNYGTFEFSDDFYLQFAQGKLNYRLSRSNFESFNYEYIMTGRGVLEQVLALDSATAQAVFDFLEVNYLPENRYYLYDFFYDNCATRIGDVLNNVAGDRLAYNSAFAPDSASFRNMIDLYLIGMPWADFGIDIALGAPCDKKMSAQQNMFLPDYVFYELQQATLDGRPLVREVREVLPPQFSLTAATIDVPVVLAGGIALVFFILLMLQVIRGKAPAWPARILLVIMGLLGIAVFLLWFATDHVTTKYNYNLLWAFPLHLIVAFAWDSKAKWATLYRRVGFVVYILIAALAWVLPQDLHTAGYLFSIALLFAFAAAYLRDSRFSV